MSGQCSFNRKNIITLVAELVLLGSIPKLDIDKDTDFHLTRSESSILLASDENQQKLFCGLEYDDDDDEVIIVSIVADKTRSKLSEVEFWKPSGNVIIRFPKATDLRPEQKCV